MVTIEEVYSKLIREGIQRGYEVIAEFCVSSRAQDFNKKIDIVWVQRRAARVDSNVGSLRQWEVKAAFEIEGYNVPMDRIAMHKAQFDRLIADHTDKFPFYVVLYTRADHRTDPDWGDGDPRREDILFRRKSRSSPAESFHVVDGRALDEVIQP